MRNNVKEVLSETAKNTKTDLGLFSRVSAVGTLSGIVYGVLLALISITGFIATTYWLYLRIGEDLARYVPLIVGIVLLWAFSAHTTLTQVTFRRTVSVKGWQALEDFWLPSLFSFAIIFITLFFSGTAWVQKWLR